MNKGRKEGKQAGKNLQENRAGNTCLFRDEKKYLQRDDIRAGILTLRRGLPGGQEAGWYFKQREQCVRSQSSIQSFSTYNGVIS